MQMMSNLSGPKQLMSHTTLCLADVNHTDSIMHDQWTQLGSTLLIACNPRAQ